MPTPTNRRDISRTVSASKNLRAISMSLVQKLRTSDGISSTAIANQLATDAVRDLVTSLNVSEQHLIAVEKNIRRRLYDSLKVLVSIGAIRRRSDKTLSWQGVAHLIPHRFSSSSRVASQQTPNLSKCVEETRGRVQSKSAALQHLTDQVHALERLNHRNRVRRAPVLSPKLQLPFVLVRTPSTSEIKLETTKDARSLAFHFSEPFEVINDYNILDRIFFVTEVRDRNVPNSLPPHSPRNSQLQLQLQVTPQKRVVLASHTVHTSPSDRRPEELPSPASLIGSAQKRKSSGRRTSETPGQSPKRRRVSGVSQFTKYTSGDKPPLSPATPFLRGPRGKRPLRRVKIRSPLQASLRALAASPRSFHKAALDDTPSRSPESLRSRGDEGLCTPEAGIRRTARTGSSEKNADRLAESFLKSPEVRSSGPLKKRIYGPGRDFLNRRDASGTPDREDFAHSSDELHGNADIMLTPGMSPLQGFSPRSSQSPAGARPVARRLFSND